MKTPLASTVVAAASRSILVAQQPAEYRAANAADPSYAEGRNNLGFALESLGRLDEAITAYREALAFVSVPRAAEAHNDLGVSLAGLGRLQEARDEFQAALAIRPDFPDARANLARTAGRKVER